MIPLGDADHVDAAAATSERQDDASSFIVSDDDTAHDANADAAVAVDASPDTAVISLPPLKSAVAVRTLTDKSTYHGEVNAAGDPHGAGVLDSCFGIKYAGDFCCGEKHGFGVLLYINGATYAGAFAHDEPSGFGVHTSPFAERYIGEWRDGARHGIGLCIEPTLELLFGQFVDNELDAAVHVLWSDVQQSVQQALEAERRSMQRQEMARTRYLDAALEVLSVVDGTCFHDAGQIARFEAQAQNELQQFVQVQTTRLADVERAANAHKLREAELKQQQKLLRRDIDTSAQELTFVAKYSEIAHERAAQVEDAEQTLHMLERQLQHLVAARVHDQEDQHLSSVSSSERD